MLRYRLYFAPKGFLTTLVGESPRAQRLLEKVKGIVRRRLLPKMSAWVRIQSGISQGIWMNLEFPDEARYWRGEHELEVQEAIAMAVREGYVVYDVGAHLGYFALGAARLAGDSGRVIAFESDPDNAKRLRDHILRNGLSPRVQVIQAAVWSSTGSNGIPFRRSAKPRAQGGVEAAGYRPIVGSAELITVPAVSLDDFVSGGEPSPDLLKIDVEGGEVEVLRGSPRLFEKKRPLIITEVHLEAAAEQIDAWMKQYRYRSAYRIPQQGYPRYLFAWPDERKKAAWAWPGCYSAGSIRISAPSSWSVST